jgi:hypothetical protein
MWRIITSTGAPVAPYGVWPASISQAMTPVE